MEVKQFIEALGAEFYTGVPDSLLRALCDYLMETYGISSQHIVAANEGNAVGLAAGYYMATGKIPVVYMQNSGIGNAVNPVASLLNEKVYGIPCIFVIGWRGEPGVHDEPQHIFQGEITIQLLEDLGLKTVVVDKTTTPDEIAAEIKGFQSAFSLGKSIAFVIKKDSLAYEHKVKYQNKYLLKREEIIKMIVDNSEGDIIVSTTGKASRELFEIREANGQGHGNDFLTVGSMGHSSSIALSVALQKTDRRVWSIDGDGAALMHMGAMAIIGEQAPKNLVHIVINNGAHESVGGIPTAAKKEKMDFVAIAKGCGYGRAVSVDNERDLLQALQKVKEMEELTLIEVKSAIGARTDLGRPTVSARENISDFMRNL